MDGCSPSCLYEEELCSVLYPGSEDDDVLANCDDSDCSTAKHCDPGEQDEDGDGFTPNMGDCNDSNSSIHPAAQENCNNGVDDNCNGLTDNAEGDQDGDGANRCIGGAVYDCNDNSAAQSPLNFEVEGDGVDNDCDTVVDEDQHACDCSGGEDQAEAMGMCVPSTVTQYYDNASHGVNTSYGNINTQYGCRFFMISSGNAWDTTGYPSTSQGTIGNPVFDTGCMACTTNDTQNTWAHMGPEGCCENNSVNDPSRLRIQVQVPANARSFSFQFIFMSIEYPEYVHTSFNDTLYVVSNSSALAQTQNITFAAADGSADTLQPMTINNGYFEDPAIVDIDNTGFELPSGASTGWVTTTAPCTPGETLILEFWIHDEGDHILDSAAIIDNFQWYTNTVDGPVTIK
jgi:hypothetical protein